MRYVPAMMLFAVAAAIGACVEADPEPPPAGICTMDAKQCPDGSFVGRSGPNCEFVCPPVPTGG